MRCHITNLNICRRSDIIFARKIYNPDIKTIQVDPGGPVVIILATGSEVRGMKPGRGRWIYSERKNPQYDFLRKGSKAVS